MQKADYHMMWLSSSLHLWHAAVVRGSRINADLIKAANIELLEQGCGYIPPPDRTVTSLTLSEPKSHPKSHDQGLRFITYSGSSISQASRRCYNGE